jgi:CxxC motif-containing protein (DUF1111 family)
MSHWLRAVLCLWLLTGAAYAEMPVAVADASREAFTHPIGTLNAEERQRFFAGRSLFRQSWVEAPAQDLSIAGLGPLYNRLSCLACHQKNGRGHAPGSPDERMQSMLVRLSVPGRGPHGGPNPHPAYGDQLNEEGVLGVPGEGRARVTWEESSTTLADGTPVSLRRPRVEFAELAYGSLDGVRFSPRVSPPVFGLGLLEAVPEATLRRMSRETKPDGVRGRINRVWDAQRRRTVAGRFGLKANQPNVRQQSAGAFIGDLGITNPLAPQENCTAAQTACRQTPSARHPELTRQQLDDVAFYLDRLAPPARRDVDLPAVQRGEAQFAALGCTACHRPQLRTGKHPRHAVLSHQTIAPYTDLLIHDMGADLADGRPDFQASGREWRTPPLWGVGLVERVNETLNLLHDGRARTFEEAILWHGGEGQAARDRYARLPKAAREELQAFLGSL